MRECLAQGVDLERKTLYQSIRIKGLGGMKVAILDWGGLAEAKLGDPRFSGRHWEAEEQQLSCSVAAWFCVVSALCWLAPANKPDLITEFPLSLTWYFLITLPFFKASMGITKWQQQTLTSLLLESQPPANVSTSTLSQWSHRTAHTQTKHTQQFSGTYCLHALVLNSMPSDGHCTSQLDVQYFQY